MRRVVDLGIGLNRTILVAGSGRSGTTWLGSVLAKATRSRMVFEPFLHDSARRFTMRDGPPNEFVDRQIYIPQRATASAYDRQLKSLLLGRSHPVRANTDRSGLYFGRVVKAIRANLLLGYLARRWPQLQIVFVYRNPAGVVDSQLKMIRQGWQFGWDPEFVVQQPGLMEDWLEPFREKICGARRLIDKLALKWCIENYVPLNQLKDRNNVLIVCYDQLVRDRRHWSTIAKFLDRHHWRSDRIGSAIEEASWSSDATSVGGPNERLTCSELGGPDLRAIRATVANFGLLETWRPTQPVPPQGKCRRRILVVTSAGVKNYGDDAILLSTLERLGRVCPGCERLVVSDGKHLPPLKGLGEWVGTCAEFCQNLPSEWIRLGCLPRDRMAKELLHVIHDGQPGNGEARIDWSRIDLVLVAGGGNLCTLWPHIVARRTAIAAAARAVDVPILVTGQGLGPLDDQIKPWVAFLINAAERFGVRDPESMALLEQTGLAVPHLALSGDDAWGFGPESGNRTRQRLAEAGIPLDKPLLGFHARQAVGVGIDWPAQVHIAKCADRAAKRLGMQVLGIPVKSGEVDLLMRLLQQENVNRANWFVVDPGDDVRAVSGLVKHCSAVVAQSHHVSLFALEGRVPTVYFTGSEYSRRKSDGLGAVCGVPCPLRLTPDADSATILDRFQQMRAARWNLHMSGQRVDRWLGEAIDSILRTPPSMRSLHRARYQVRAA